jgi:hypothetical protein
MLIHDYWDVKGGKGASAGGHLVRTPETGQRDNIRFHAWWKMVLVMGLQRVLVLTGQLRAETPSCWDRGGQRCGGRGGRREVEIRVVVGSARVQCFLA